MKCDFSVDFSSLSFFGAISFELLYSPSSVLWSLLLKRILWLSEVLDIFKQSFERRRFCCSYFFTAGTSSVKSLQFLF